MTEKVECPKCGRKVSKRGLGSHKNSRNCKARATKKEYKEKGWKVVFSKKVTNYIKEQDDMDIEHDKTGSYEGGINRRGGFNYGYYAPEEDIEKARKQVLPNPDDEPRHKKIAQEDGYLLVKKIDKQKDDYESVGKLSYIDIEEENTRKRKFLISNDMVFTVKGERIGEVVDKSIVPEKLVDKAVMESI